MDQTIGYNRKIGKDEVAIEEKISSAIKSHIQDINEMSIGEILNEMQNIIERMPPEQAEIANQYIDDNKNNEYQLRMGLAEARTSLDQGGGSRKRRKSKRRKMKSKRRKSRKKYSKRKRKQNKNKKIALKAGLVTLYEFENDEAGNKKEIFVLEKNDETQHEGSLVIRDDDIYE